ncbi:MAG: WYL domain-containing protein [Alphaproteobacteria bacterium]|nr:WYL domain-containing protein [Alphaproteobacteria bacterium]
MAKNLVGKYVWLVETIYNAGRITYDDINKKWQQEDFDGKELPLRTFHKWRIAVEEMFGLNIECERKGGYHYYIGNPEEIENRGLRSWLLSTISVSNLLLDSQQLKSRILLEEVPSGVKYLSLIIDAMKTGNVVQIEYQSFWRKESSTLILKPYCVRLFKQRWYLLAYNSDYNELRTYSLDRIQDFKKLADTFTIPDSFNAQEYFENYYGIIVKRGEVEDVKLRASKEQANYLRSLKLHHSQQEVETHEDYSIFTYRLCPELDFIIEIMSMGERVEVLEPKQLRNQIAESAEQLSRLYNG